MNSLPCSTHTILQTYQSLPTKWIIALKPWFTKEILQQGHNILRKEAITFFIFQRRFAGVILNNTTVISLQMGEKKGMLPFVFRDGDCSKCEWQQGGGSCKHVAALALLCLQQQNDTLQTLADLFTDSAWHSISRYLHEQITMRRKITIAFQPHIHGMLFQGTSKNGLHLEIIMSNEAAQELADFFPSVRKALSVSKSTYWEDHHDLLEELIEHTCTGVKRN